MLQKKECQVRDLSPFTIIQTMSDKTHRKVKTNSAPEPPRAAPSKLCRLEKHTPGLPTANMIAAMELEDAEQAGKREHTACCQVGAAKYDYKKIPSCRRFG